MRRRFFFRAFAVWAGALASACKGESPTGPRAHHRPSHVKGGDKDWDAWNERRYERDLKEHGLGIYAYELAPSGKYGDLTYDYPPMDGTVMSVPKGDYEVRIPAGTYE